MNPPTLDVKQAWTSRELEHDRQLYRAQFSPDGCHVAAGGQDGIVHLWDLDVDVEEKTTMGAHPTWISSLVFHPKAHQLFTADYHGVIHCWGYGDKAASAPQWSIPDAHHNNVRAMIVTPDGRHLVSAGDDARVRVWDIEAQGKAVAELEEHEECIFSLAISPDGQHLVSGDLFGVIHQWDIHDSWKRARELNARRLHTRKENFLADVGGARSFAFSPNGRTLAVGGMKDIKSNAFCPGKPTVLVFDWASGAVTTELGLKGKSDGPFNALRFLSDEILVGHSEQLHSPSELTFWNIGNPAPLHSVKNHSAYDLSLHPDGRQLLATCYVSGGSTGNGVRGRKREEYTPNTSSLRIFSLFAKPDDAAGS